MVLPSFSVWPMIDFKVSPFHLERILRLYSAPSKYDLIAQQTSSNVIGAPLILKFKQDKGDLL